MGTNLLAATYSASPLPAPHKASPTRSNQLPTRTCQFLSCPPLSLSPSGHPALALVCAAPRTPNLGYWQWPPDPILSNSILEMHVRAARSPLELTSSGTRSPALALAGPPPSATPLRSPSSSPVQPLPLVCHTPPPAPTTSVCTNAPSAARPSAANKYSSHPSCPSCARLQLCQTCRGRGVSASAWSQALGKDAPGHRAAPLSPGPCFACCKMRK